MSSHDPELEAAALALLDEALEQPEPSRRAFLAARTDADDRVRARAAVLLDLADEAGAAVRTGGAGGGAREPAPETIGVYRIVGLLGRGGMGAVYRAEREAGDFRHTVAIKVIRPGVLSPQAVQRFERERQILADLEHPNIARLFDGGRTGDGRPFIVMELVAGRPVTEWVRDRALPLAARLEVFTSICDAVAHAHQKLVIHRDITSGNVLVTHQGVVKLIDFGIARPPEAELREGAAASLAGLSLTPGFAAPERLVGAAASTLMDVYALGRLLDAVTADLPADREVRAIAARAAAEDPASRYPSVDALLDDVRRRLTGRPVRAFGGGRRYAVSKFVGRHRRAAAGSAIGVGLLVTAFVVTLGAYAAAEQARAAEARRFDELRTLARYMLFDLNPQLSRTPGNTQARVVLAGQAQRYLSALATSPRADDGVRLEAARGLIALANVQGVPAQPNLGDVPRARANLKQASSLLDGLALAGAAVAPERARALAAQALMAMNIDAAAGVADRALLQAETHLDGVEPQRRGRDWLMARRLVRRVQLEAAVLGQRPTDLRRLADRLEAEVRAWPPDLQASREAALDRGNVELYRAIRAYFQDDFQAGVDAAQRGVRILDSIDARTPNDPETLYALAWTHYSGFGAASGLPNGEALAARFVAGARRAVTRLVAVEEHDNSLKSFASQIAQAQSQTLSAQKRHGEALAVQADSLRLLYAALLPDRKPAMLHRLLKAELIMGDVALGAGDRALACGSYERSLRLLTEAASGNKLLGSAAAHQAPLKANVGLCAQRAPLSALRKIG